MKKIFLGLLATVLFNAAALGQIAIDAGQNAITIDENTTGSILAEIITTNLPLGTLTWSISSTDNPDSDTNDPILIDPQTGELTVNDPDDIDFELGASFQFTVVVNDDGDASSDNEVFTITLTNLNDNDPVVTASQSFSLAEDAGDDDVVGTVLATDDDDTNEAAFTTFETWLITAGNDDGVFAIDGSTGQITVADSTTLDFETTISYSLSVTVSDETNPSVAEMVTVNITDVNDKPQLTTTTATIAENSAADAAIATLTYSDDEDADVEFTINSGNASGAFALTTAGALTIADSADFDHETNPEFKLAIKVTETDETTVFSIDTLTVTVTDVNEAPVMTKTTLSFNENPAAQGIIGAIPVTDPEEDDLTYTITSGNGGGNYAIVDDTLRANTPAYFDFETFTTDTLIVSATDAAFSDSDTIFVKLLNVNEPLVFPDTIVSIDENNAADALVAQLEADDPEGINPTFKILTFAPDSAFYISLTGNLQVGDSALLDFETNPVFTLTVEATDGTFKDTATVTININDVFEIVNDKPNFPDQSFNVAENSPIGEVIGKLIATDTIEGPLKYRVLTGNELSIIALSDTSGVLGVNDSVAFDFEKNTSFEFEIETSDGLLTDTATVTVFLLDVSEPPSVDEGVFSIDENSPAATLVGKLNGVDGDGDDLFFALGEGNDGAFVINNAGTITVANSTKLNFEEKEVFEITVLVSDEVDTIETTATINILDVNDPPRFANKLFEIEENQEVGTIVGNLDAFDEDGDEITFVIRDGNVSNAFAVTTDGDIVVANEEAIDFEQRTTITLVVSALDGTVDFEDIVEIKITDLIDNILITGVDEIPIVKFYPNPTIDRMTVEALEPIQQLRIVDMAGRIMTQLAEPVRDRVVIDVSSFQSGMYILIVDHQAFKFMKR
ncbi:MAG: cadherin domain-containing protein [Cyclobacteriaceae bacterium]